MKELTVAVCIPTYNQAEYLQKSIQSALDQTFPVSVYVCDDKSTDETKLICERFKNENSNFHYQQNEENLGIAKNVNKLLRWPETDFIVRLDSDDLLHPDYVQSLLSLFKKYPEAGVGHVNVQQIDEKDQFTRKRLLSRSKEYYPAEKSLEECIYGYKVAANICMFKRQVLEELDFTSGRPEYTEDYDLWVRIADANWGNVFSTKILAYYRVWIDKNNYRVSLHRKEAELIGYQRLFDECIEPAYRKRNWSLDIVKRQREKFALEHAVALKSSYFNEPEKEVIIERVLNIYDSKRVRSRIASYLNPGSFQSKYFSLKREMILKIKDLVKSTQLLVRKSISA